MVKTYAMNLNPPWFAVRCGWLEQEKEIPICYVPYTCPIQVINCDRTRTFLKLLHDS